LGHILFQSTHSTQSYPSQQKCKDFIGLNFGMNVDMSAVEDDIFQGNGLIDDFVDVIFIKIGCLKHHIDFKLLR